MVDAVRGGGGRHWLTCVIVLVAGLCGVGADADSRLVLRCQVSIRYDSTPFPSLHLLCARCAMVDTVRGDGGRRWLTCGIVLVAGLCGVSAAADGRLVLRCQVSIRCDSTPIHALHLLCA
jgi:hypothetical protein